MSFLLDTHALLYFGCDYREKIGKGALEIFRNPDSKLFVSQIAYWELAIKINIGKLDIPIGLESLMVLTKEAGIEMIPMNNRHILQYQSLEIQESHKDPFDRYIVSTALCEDMKILSCDSKFDLYGSAIRIWD